MFTTKFLTAVSLLIGVCYALDSAEFLELGRSIIQPHLSECMCATGVDAAIASKFMVTFQLTNDPCFKCFLKCFFDKLDLLNPDNSINVDTYMRIIPGGNLTLNEICSNQTVGVLDPCQKFFDYTNCYLSLIKSQ